MTKLVSRLVSAAMMLAAMCVASALAPPAPAVPSPAGKRPTPGGQQAAWQDDFNGPKLDRTRWVIASGQAPGHITDFHIGYYDPSHVDFVSDGSGSYLRLLLTQETGPVDSSSSGVISRGALVYTKTKYGYGTYEWRMRMSSTATSPNDPIGTSVSGSVSAGFIYVNNSETEIDFEFSGRDPDTLYLVNWKNPNPPTGPTGANETFSTLYPFTVSAEFHNYKFVWGKTQISFYVDGVLQAVHTTNVPTVPANFMINHWGTDSGNWGGTATIGVDRYFYVDWARYTPPQ